MRNRPAQQLPDLTGIINQFRPDMQPFPDLYKYIHSHPELGTQESQTAFLVARHLRYLGLNIIEGIGVTALLLPCAMVPVLSF